MTNDETRMTNQFQIDECSNDGTAARCDGVTGDIHSSSFRHSSFNDSSLIRHSTFVIRHWAIAAVVLVSASLFPACAFAQGDAAQQQFVFAHTLLQRGETK